MLSCLVAFLLREKDSYYIPFPAHIAAPISEIQQLSPPTQLPPPVIQDNINEYALKIKDLLIAIWTHIWDPSLRNTIQDPTMCFLTLSSIRADNSWAQATKITPIIARIIFSIWSIFLFHIHTGRKETETLHKKYQALEHWYYEEEESTFHELCMLQHIASSIAYTTLTLPAFIWYNEQCTEFIWHGSKIMLSMLKEMGQLLLQWTYKAFTDNILLGHPWKIADYITDDLSNATPGYSFVSDTRNHQFYNRKSFLTFIMNNPKL